MDCNADHIPSLDYVSQFIDSSRIDVKLNSLDLISIVLICDCVHDQGFDHNGNFSSYDYKSVRRGYQVYKEVCATCHSLEGIAFRCHLNSSRLRNVLLKINILVSVPFRNLVNVTHTEEQMKVLAADIDIEDGPNDEGIRRLHVQAVCMQLIQFLKR